MSAHRVLFKPDDTPAIERTEIGTVIGYHLSPEAKARVRAELASGPALTAFDLGVYEPPQAPRFARTLVGIPAPLRLPDTSDDDTVVVDDPDA